MKFTDTENYDERQVQIRGNIMTQCFILTIAMLFSLALINDVCKVDLVGLFGFGDIVIGCACLGLAYGSVMLILKGAYFGIVAQTNMKMICYTFSVLSVIDIILNIIDLYHHEPIGLLSICSILMLASISISLWIKRSDWIS